MSEAGSFRAVRRRGRERSPSRRAIGLAVFLGVLVVFSGLREQGREDGPGQAGPRVSVPKADAASDTRSLPPRAAENGPSGGNAGWSPSSPRLAEEPLPPATLPAAVSPDRPSDPADLSTREPPARIAMPEMALRSDTIRPSEPVVGDAAGPIGGRSATGALRTAALPRTIADEIAGPRTPPAPRLAGTWAADRSACTRRNSAFLPLVIDAKGARAGGSSCRFGRRQQDGNRWSIAATCRSGQETWTANVRLVVEATRLTWSSERGTQRYQRCR